MKMKKLIALVLAVLTVFALAACGSSSSSTAASSASTDSTAAAASTETASAGQLILGTSADYAPFEFMYPDSNGNMQFGGIDISVAQYVADYEGVDLQIENMDFNYLLTALNKGDFDMVLACIEPTEERMKAVDFSDPYMYSLPEMILVRAEDADKYTDMATSFNGVSVGAQAGSTKVQKANDKLIGCNVVELTAVTDLVNELVNGKIDAIYLDGDVAANYAATNSDLVVCSASDGLADTAANMCIAVAKGDPKGLLPQINEALAKMTEENKIEEFQALADSLSGVAQEVSADAPEGYTPDSQA